MEKPMLKHGWLSTELEAGKNEVQKWPEWMRRQAEVREPTSQSQACVKAKPSEEPSKQRAVV